MEYYIVTDISENYNYVNDLAYKCKMEIIDYLKYSIMTSFNIDIQNIKIIYFLIKLQIEQLKNYLKYSIMMI